jgi:hypothetical protein
MLLRGSNDTGVPALPAPRLLGPLAWQNHRWEVHALVEECLGAPNKADPSMQRSLALQQKALLVRPRDIAISVASTAHEARHSREPLHSRGRGLPRLLVPHMATCKWHKSALEHQHPNVKSRATQQADQVPLQKTFANVRRDVADQHAKYLTASECNGLFTGAQAQPSAPSASATLPECWLQDEALPESYRGAKDGQDSFRALPQAHPSTCGARGAADWGGLAPTRTWSVQRAANDFVSMCPILWLVIESSQ